MQHQVVRVAPVLRSAKAIHDAATRLSVWARLCRDERRLVDLLGIGKGLAGEGRAPVTAAGVQRRVEAVAGG